ncbi:type IV secretory system conjugative DNA transfer family protein [Nocardiopsis oceani]
MLTDLTLNIPAIAATVLGGLASWVASVFALRAARYAYLRRGAQILEIHAPPETTVDQATAFWTHTLGLLRPRWTHRLLAPHLSWEYIASTTGIRIQIWLPGTVSARSLERAVQADWPGATTRIRPATTAIPDGAHVAGGWQRLSRGDQYPIRTKFTEDPLRGLLGELSDLAPGQNAVVRICARPASPRRAASGRASAAQLRGVRTSLLNLQPPASGAGTTVFPGITDDVRAILRKAAAPRLACQISVLVSTGHTGAAVHRRIRARASAIAACLAAYTSGLNGFRRQWTPIPRLWTNRRYLARGYLLTTEELAALAHLPTDTAVPGLTRASARRIAPSPDVPRTGRVRVLGEADIGPARPVAYEVAAGRHHTHILGKTGSGKSTLLTNMVLQDAEAGRSALLLDPRGDLVTDVLDRLPKSAIGTTALFDPADPAPPPRINILQLGSPEHAADTVTGIFRKLYASSWGPRMEDILRASTLTLARAQDPSLTIGDIPRLLADHSFAQHTLARQRTEDPALVDFWVWYAAQSPQMRAAATDPLLNKLRSVLLRPWASAVLASGATTVDLPHLLDHGGLVLMRLSKGRLGEETAALIGTLTLAATWHTITARASVPEHRRPDTSLYIDEAANFLRLPGSLADMLAEARGYRAAMVIAHQELSQFPADTRAAVHANCRTKILFNSAPEDAAKLERHTLPHLRAHDLSHLGPYQAAVRTLHGAAELPACTMRTRPLPGVIPKRAAQIRKASKAVFSPRTARTKRTRRPDPRTQEGDY